MAAWNDVPINLKASIGQIQPAEWTILFVTIVSVAVWVHKGRKVSSNPTKGNAADKDVQPPKNGKVIPPQGHVTVSRILVHPIKSCRGISVQSAAYTPEGLEYDRIWSIIDAEKRTIITARTAPKMVLITPIIERDDTLPHRGVLRVSFPPSVDCPPFTVPLEPTQEILRNWQLVPQITIWPTSDPVDGYICEGSSNEGPSPSEILTKYFEKPVHLVYKGPRPRDIDATTTFPELKATAKYQDMYPLLILSEESTGSVEKELRNHVGTQGINERWRTDSVAIERFRPNIILKGGGPFAEDGWEEIKIGAEDSPTMTLVSRCTRCLLPNVSPETGEKDAAVPFKVLMKFRTGLDPVEKMKPCVGCNAVPAANGVIKVGDWVFVKKVIEEVNTR